MGFEQVPDNLTFKRMEILKKKIHFDFDYDLNYCVWMHAMLYENFDNDCNGWCNLHNAGCIMQAAGHVLWPRAAWLYHGATFLMVISLFIAGGLVSSKFMFAHKVHVFELDVGPTEKGRLGKFESLLRGSN